VCGGVRIRLANRLLNRPSALARFLAIDALRSAAAIVDQKATTDAAGFKGWLLAIAGNVAEASKEGGFLGFGGVPVSPAEKATLSEIATALETRA